ncbi:hypothetical protein EG329_006565 [Mollisiaceae sp. DMI_Dod_QoI]|nr:hypothetical protein EG329_006565 [Helotiales sp. DMI_Dod_QoI]
MEQPPPYPGSTSRKRGYDCDIKDFEYLQDRDLKTCLHSHELLVCITEEQHYPTSTTLHHWDSVHTQSSTSTSTSLSMKSKLSRENINLIRGLRDLGAFNLSASEVSGAGGLHQYLSSILDGNKKLSRASSDAEAITSIIFHIGSPSSSFLQTDLIPVHLFTIQVLGDSAEALFSSGFFPAWKWTRQDGQKKRGFWKPDLEDVILDAHEYLGGKIGLLVQGVSDERKEELRRGMIIFPASTSK